jgi:hypothetical protein
VIGDANVAAAMIDRLVHHEVINLKGDRHASRTSTSGACQQPTQRDETRREGGRKWTVARGSEVRRTLTLRHFRQL